MTYGYYSTSIGSQSKTFEYVIVVESPISFAAGSREQAYVSFGRAKLRTEIVTNDKKQLLEAVMPSSRRHSAMEMVEPKPDLNPQPENDRADLREAQKRAEKKMTPKERTKLQLGRHRTVQALVPQPKPEKLKAKLGHGRQVPVPAKVNLEWKLPAVLPVETAEPLKNKLGEVPEKLEWKLPAILPQDDPVRNKPDIDEGRTPRMLP